MLNIGVVGTGHLGKIHVKCILGLPEMFNLVGFYDTDEDVRAEVEKEFGIAAFQSLEALIAAVDVVDIVTPTVHHFELAKQVATAGKHLFIEKPITHTAAEAHALAEIVRKAGVKVQVGHVERFNPALLSLGQMNIQPRFIEGHRLATFNPRGTDVSVVHDLMIHDLDIVLHLVQSEVAQVSANGVAIVSASPDIANVRLEFVNGCIVNLTASRISLKQMRKLRLFQSDAYISLDFLDKQAQVVRLHTPSSPELEGKEMTMPLDTARGERVMSVEMPEITPVNAIQKELEDLALSIMHDREPTIGLEDGISALVLAERINTIILETLSAD